jgi:hypothetical protein
MDEEYEEWNGCFIQLTCAIYILRDQKKQKNKTNIHIRYSKDEQNKIEIRPQERYNNSNYCGEDSTLK